jgi:hypothetical protein
MYFDEIEVPSIQIMADEVNNVPKKKSKTTTPKK